MSRRLFSLAAAAGLMLPMSAALADQDLASIARTPRDAGGAIDVTAHYLAPSSCYGYTGFSRSAPAGASVPDIAVPLTVVVDKQGRNCSDGATLLRDVFIVFPQGNTLNVKVFFVSPSGKRLKTEEIAIINR